MRNLSRLLLVTAILTAAWAPAPAHTAEPSAAASPGTLPARWDKRIPLPPAAVLLSSTPPKEGVVYSADLARSGSYEELVKFYEAQLAEAGFKMGPKVAIPARKVYNRTFTWTDTVDSVVMTPSTADPSKMSVHVTYTPLP